LLLERGDCTRVLEAETPTALVLTAVLVAVDFVAAVKVLLALTFCAGRDKRVLSIFAIKGKFLFAHKHLMDLENSRDELLYELHRQPQQSKTNLLTIRTYFKDVSPLNAKMKSGFLPEARPKKWRERAFATMENQCKNYIDVFLSQPDQSSSDAAWLVHQLELAKSQIMGDE